MRKKVVLLFTFTLCFLSINGFGTNIFGEYFHHDSFLFTPEEKREAIVLQSEEQAELAEYAKNDPERFVRRAALVRIHDQKFFIDIAQNSVFFDMRRDAVGKVNDKAVLELIISNDDNLEVRQAAIIKTNALTILFNNAQNAKIFAVKNESDELNDDNNNKMEYSDEVVGKRNAEGQKTDFIIVSRAWPYFLFPLAVYGIWLLLRQRKKS